jgi:putative tryptophan/tyrosine transport system substrate-binding protein
LLENYMRRREFIALVGGATFGWPLAARAQQRSMPVVGILNSGSAPPFAPMIAAFDQGLSEQGYVVGRNVRTELRWANGEYDRLPELAAELAGLRVDVLASPGGDVATVASMAATKTIPIVFMVGRNPVKAGFVAHLNRPGGNATGVNILTSELAAKRLQLLRDLVPNVGSIGVLVNPNNPNAATDPQDLQEAAATLGLQLSFLQASNPDEIAAAFTSFAGQKLKAVLVNTDPYYLGRRDLLAELAARHSLPAIYSLREHAVAGGLISYGANLIEAYRLLGGFAGRILRGAKPADMPVEQPTKYVLTINMKAAKALALEIPATLLARADEVIE